MERPPTSSEVKFHYLGHRPGRWRRVLRVAAVVAVIALVVALALAAAILLVSAYARQSDRVEALEAQNQSILQDHHTIGARFAEQSKRFARESRRLEEAVQSSYGRGFRAGREAASLPAELRSLAGQAAAGLLVPRRVPEAAGTRRSVVSNLNGYTVRWEALALFASRLEPLTNWTRQALGERRRLQVGPQRVERLVGPSGVIYAWRKSGVTYAVIGTRTSEPLARALIASMR